jgi:hypothetical protein
MSAIQLGLGLARLGGIVLPALLCARLLRLRYSTATGAVGLVVEIVLALSVLLLCAEALGLIGLMRSAALIPALVLLLLILWRMTRGQGISRAATSPAQSEGGVPASMRDATSIAAFVAVVVVGAQWCVQSANALGSGMSNFDTLWYHMPFAAHMAQTGSVTAIQFTQADPFVAYFPANSELLHAIGIVALRSDFLSPLLNLFWLFVALLACWCLGRPWRVERLTLIAGALVTSLPVLSGTQPGEAFNDIAGLAMLLAAVAVAVNAAGSLAMLSVAGLALGIAVGTKLTFVVPALALLAGICACAKRGSRRQALRVLLPALCLTGGWWYLRNLLAVGNPLGLRLHVGPLALPGPSSPLANASQQTVISQVSHLSLWSSRFAPGLDHALGPLWPLVLALYLCAVIVGIVAVKASIVRALALTAGLAGVSYLFLPTGASAIEQGATLFAVNLRYATPALALGLIIVPILLRLLAPSALGVLGPTLAALIAITQLEHSLWPTQTARHLAFLVGVAALAACLLGARHVRVPRRLVLVAGALGLALASFAAAFVVQRHYFNRRYLVGDSGDPGLGVLYGWAQHVADARVALYGTVQQYPLYGARDTNRVDYLGQPVSGGGFRPLASCRTWRRTVDRGHYRYLVLTPAPTTAIPLAWTAGDPAARLVLHPAPQDYVFELTGRLSPGTCA